MIHTYLLIALRAFLKEKVYSFINILGLTLGVCFFLLIALFVRIESSYDSYHQDSDQIYRVITQLETAEGRTYSALTGGLVGPYFKESYGTVLASARLVEMAFSPTETAVFSSDSSRNHEDGVLYADNGVFDIFHFEVVAGDPSTALGEPGSIAVSESFARRYFPNGGAINQVMQSENAQYRVTLVFKDLPVNTFLKYDALISLDSLYRSAEENPSANLNDYTRAIFGSVIPSFTNRNAYTYIKVAEDFAPADFEGMWSNLKRNNLEGNERYTGWTNLIEPLESIYLDSAAVAAGRPTGNRTAIVGFASIGFFVLLIACINYANLAVARSVKRAGAIAINKAMGASRTQLVTQFLLECALYSILAVALGFFLAEALFEYSPFNDIFGLNLSLSQFGPVTIVVAVLLSAVLLSLFSGLYPALYMASQSPVAKASDNLSNGKKRHSIFKALVTLQFTISIAVIASTVVIYLQLNYAQNKPLGFEKENRIHIPLYGVDAIENGIRVFGELKRNGLISNYSVMGNASSPGSRNPQRWMVGNLGASPEERTEFSSIYVDDQFFDTLGINLAQGRNFNQQIESDVLTAVIVNSTGLDVLARSDVVDSEILTGTSWAPRARVIGVVEDFHFLGLHEKIAPMAIMYRLNDFSQIEGPARKNRQMNLIASISEPRVRETLDEIRQRWQTIDPSRPLEFEFVEERFDGLYLSEQRQMRMFGLFSLVCILISCLGLLGLSSYSTEQRSREVAIRKALGASTMSVFLLLFKNILMLWSLSAALGSVVAYLAMKEWLEEFYYRIGVSPIIFVLVSILVGLMAFSTIAIHAVKAARKNPAPMLNVA